MKKLYFLVLAACLLVTTKLFSATWYSTPSGGAASTLTNWWSTSSGTGSNPTTFANVGDTWIIQSSMTIPSSTTWTVAGSVVLNSGSLIGTSNTINIGDSLTLNNSSYINSSSSALYFYIGGDFTMTGTSYMTNSPSYNYIYLNNTGSNSSTPQNISFTSTSTSGNWSYLYVNSGCYARMTSNCAWTAQYYPIAVSGTLDCQTYSWTLGYFTINSGATLLTGHASGVNGSVTTSGTVSLSASAKYGFNGSVAQVTGSMTPASLSGAGGLIVNNSSSTGVTLSQNTTITGTTAALTLTSGKLNTGSYSLTIPGASTAVSGGSSSSYVNGTLTKTITGYTTINYEVGNTNYSPMELTLSSAGTSGSIGVKVTGGTHPNFASSGFSSGQTVSQYWTITNNAANGPSTIIPKGVYNAGDIVGGSNASFQTNKYASSAWLSAPLASTNTSSPYTTAPTSGISLATIAGDYIFGVPVPSVYGSPSSLAFGVISTGSSSSAMTFTLGGSTLTSSSSVTVTAPSNFQVSLDGTTWSSSLSVSYTGTTLSPTTVYVRFSPTAATTYSGNITVTGGGLGSTASVVAVSGTGASTCSGTPTAGTAALSPTSGGAATTFSLSLSGTTVAGGLTYQWQSSGTGAAGSFTNISGATNPSYSFSGLSSNTYYRAVVTCPTFAAANSNTVMATFIPPTPTCTPTGSSWTSVSSYNYGVGIFTVTAAAGANLNDNTIMSSVNTSTGYLSRLSTIAPITLYKGWTHTAAAYFGSVSSYQYAQVWIDFNDDGTFQTSEQVTGVTGFSTSTTANPVALSINIPATANSGTHLMRIRGIWEYISTSLGTAPANMDPCLLSFGGVNPQYYSGTVVDYYVNVMAPPPSVVVTPASHAFPATTTGSTSSPLSSSYTGSYLTAAGTLTVTASSSAFEISPDGSTWYPSTYEIPYTGTTSTGTVYIRFLPTAATSYTGTVSITGGGLASAVNIVVTGTGAALCSGTPSGGSASVSPAAGGSTTVFTLTGSGYTVAGGVTFQWQSSEDGTTWTNISGATLPTYTFTGITATTQYRLNVTCSASGETVASTTTTALLFPLSSCTPTFYYTGCSNGFVVGSASYPLTVTGAVGTSITDPTACSSHYVDQTASTTMTATFWPGFTYSATVGNNFYSYQNSDQIWIDFNSNGSFEASETVGGNASWTSMTTTHSVAIPATVSPGVYRMRVIVTYACCGAPGYPAYPSIPPCPTTAQYYGEVRDYKITVSNPPVCTTPTAQPTALTLGTPGLSTIPVSFTASASADNYLVIATTTSTPPAAPEDEVTYAVGSTTLGGRVVYFGPSTSFTASGFAPGTTYYFWVYAAKSFCAPGPKYLTASPLTGSATTNACAISGTKTVGPTGDYATLTAAISALTTNGMAGAVALELQTSYTASGETLPITIPNIPCISATNNLVIRPQGTMTVTASSSAGLINLDGARFVTIDGRVGSTGTTKALTIVNTSTSAATLTFINDAVKNTVKYTTVRGVTALSNSGVILFSTTTGTTGNDSNVIDNCDILDGSSTPYYSIYGGGTTGKENSGNVISNCNIANYYAGTFGFSNTAGINVASGNTGWTISNNRFYQTTSRSYSYGYTHYAMNISPSTSGSGFVITGNTIGYSSSTSSGTYAMTSTSSDRLYAIYLNTGLGTVNSIQGNTITNVSLTGTSSGAMTFYGIWVAAGSANIGDVTPNIVGAATGTGAISVSNAGGSSTPTIAGIYSSATSPAIANVQNNTIGSLTTSNTSTSSNGAIYGIWISSSSSATVTGNTVGSTSTSNSINASSATTSATQPVYGIFASVTSSTAVNPLISNNTIANLNNASTASGSYAFGIYFNSSALMTIQGNTIRNITGNSSLSGSTTLTSVAGILITASTNATNISQNTIYSIYNNNTATTATHVSGIHFTGATNGSITRNKIYDIRNASTGTTATAPPIAAGIMLYLPVTSVTIANNMITLGNGVTSNTSFAGVMNSTNSTYTVRAYHNSIVIDGTVSSGALGSSAYRRGNFSTTPLSSITQDVKNNIFVNNRTGGTGKHYAISNNGTTSSSAGWTAGASNYNILKSATASTLGYWSGDRTFAAWQSSSAGDANSYNTSAVTFTNIAAGDLHINMGTTGNDVESHGVTITGLNNDFDNDTRPGPVGSTNGGGIAPDLGADEFDGVPNDNLGPTISYTALLGSCGTGDRTLTVNIADYSSVPTTGTTRPMIYFKKSSSGSWSSAYGTLSSGTGASGVWSFTISSSAMGGLSTGETIQYFVVAQDNLGYVSASPNTGFAASSVTSISTYPTTPNTYNVQISLSGTKTVGTGGDYATLTLAAADYNNACISGAVTFSLISSSYASETYPITFNANPYASATNTLTIKPASGVTAAFSTSISSSALIKLNGADYITIDGSNTAGGTTRDLTFTNSFTSTGAVIWNAAMSGAGNGADNNTIKNVNIVGGTSTITSCYGIVSGNTSGITTAGDDNKNFTVQNCSVKRAGWGIYINGTATFPHTNTTITQNSVGSTTVGEYVGSYGIYLTNQTNPVISLNNVFNIRATTFLNVRGISLAGTVISGAQILRNTVAGVYGFGSGYDLYGIDLSPTTASNTVIANNMISDVVGHYGYITTCCFATGIRIGVATSNTKIYYNTVNMTGATDIGAGSGTGYSANLFVNNAQTGMEVKNNIFVNKLSMPNNGSNAFNIWLYTSGTSFVDINNNNYSGESSSTTTYRVAYVGTGSTMYNTLADWRGYTGQDAASQTVAPVFVSATDAHLVVATQNGPLIGGAAPITGFTTDIDGTTRSSTAPVQGAHEVNIPSCNTVTVTAGTPTPVTSALCGTGRTTINTTGSTGALGMTYQWRVSTDGTTFTNISGATGVSYTMPANISATRYYRFVAGCSTSGVRDSAVATVNVYPVPAAIAGSLNVCQGLTGTLTNATPGGTWSSSTAATATIGLTSGVVTGVAYGTSVITYQLPTTCYAQTTVNVVAPPIVPVITAATPVICNNSGTMLSVPFVPPVNINQDFESGIPTTPGTAVGGWNVVSSNSYLFTTSSSSSPAATPAVGSSFLIFNSWNTSTNVTMYSPSFNMAGITDAKLTFWMFRDATPSYNSSYYDPEGFTISIGTSTVSASATTLGHIPRRIGGAITGTAITGVSTPATGGWYQYQVNIPATYTGATNHIFIKATGMYGGNLYMDGLRITGVRPTRPSWSPADDLYTNAAFTTPYVAGDTVSTVYFRPTAVMSTTPITYTATVSNGGCTTPGTVTVTVNPQPEAITGVAQVCHGLSTTLANATPAGTWTSSNASVATISATGVVNGVAVGTSNVSYTLSATGCRRTQVLTVNPLPADITGTPMACVNATANLSNATPGGSWSSGTTAIATMGSLDGVMSGESAGLAIITYTLPTGCIKIVEATINPLPATSVSPSSSATLCDGNSVTLTANAPQPSFSILLQDFNDGLGTWQVTSTSGEPGSAWRLTTAPSSGATGDGTQMLEADAQYLTPTTTFLTSPSFSTLGYAEAQLSFNQFLISLASADANVDVEYSVDGGTTWSLVNSQVDEISGGGSWTASAPELTVNLPAGALGQPSVKLRWHYNSNFGLYWDIDNIKVTAFQPAVTFAWNGVSGATGLSCSACGTTTITPAATGVNEYEVISTTSSGCQATNIVTVNVNPLPAPITGSMAVCVNGTSTFSDADAGGTWSSADATVSVDAATGMVTGVTDGTATLTYTLPTGCIRTAAIVVNPQPAMSTGTMQVCEGLSTTLSNATGSGTWSSAVPAIADVTATTGVVSGLAAGNVDIYYTLTSTGCRIAANVTVNPTPATIDGTMQVCEGLTTALSNVNTGGTWYSTTTSVATIDAATGVATGNAAGMSVITYTLPTGCIRTGELTVNPLPAAITGTMQVCEGLTTTLANATTGGNWSTASASATIDAMGVVTGVTAGVANITYQLATGCQMTTDVTVNALPAAIDGVAEVCEGQATVLSNTVTGGTWASGATGIATVDASTGVVSGLIAGNAPITYQLPTGCISTREVTVNPTPAALTGVMQVCEGLNTTLSSTSAGGSWESGASGIASVDVSGIITGLNAGTSTITYTLPTGCIATADVTVNALPEAITGTMQVCEGLTTTVANATTGGNWSSSVPTVASVDGAGVVFATMAGNTTITYTLPTGCIQTAELTVNPTPAAITGTLQVCEAATTALASTSAGGAWSSSAIMTASVDAGGTVSGISAGNADITYQLPTGCITTAQVTVHPLPAAITGAGQVCVNEQTALANTSAGGAWTSGATGIATVDATTGMVTGVSAGNAGITYTLPTGCATETNILVNPTPDPITGTLQVCAGSTTGLSTTSTGGTWSSSLSGVASVISTSGVVTGNSMGNATIIYTLPTSCKTTAIMTVHPLPAPIAGSAQVCEGATGTLTNGSFGGMWTSSTPEVATVDATGLVDAEASGTTLITYTLPTGCLRTRVLVVNPLPAAITGTTQLCQSATTTLANTTTGGMWSSSTLPVATITTDGVVNGIGSGTTLVSYTLPTGCMATAVVTVNGLPSAITGVANVCEGQTATLANAIPGGTWTSASTGVATIDAATGVMTGVMNGSASIVYELPTGCSVSRNVVVNAAPAAIGGIPQVCYGATTTLTNSVTGGIWSTSAPGTAGIGLMSGVVSGLSAGTANITYTLMTGCASSATVVVNELPAAITGSLNICNGQSAALSSATTGGAWTSSNAAVADVSATGTVTTAAPGNTTIAYTLPTGCARAAVVTVNAAPAVHNVTGGGNYCTGSAGVHIGLDGSNSGTNYQLYSGSMPVGTAVVGTTGSALDFGVIAPTGTYSVVARNAATGCSSDMAGTATVAVSTIVVPAVTVSTSTGSDTLCAGTLTSFSTSLVNGGASPSYVWKVNGVTVPGATSGMYTYTPANGDVVTCTMSSSEACATPVSANYTRTLTVNENVMPAANVIATSGVNLCDGNTATFNVSALYGGTAPVYTWMKNGAVAATGSTFSYVPANGDNIYVKMTSNYACRLADSVNSSALTIATSPIYVPVVSITADPGLTVQPGTSVTLTASTVTAGPAPLYQWYIGSAAIPGATNANFTHSGFADGDSVSCVVTGTGICGMAGFNSVIMRHGVTAVTNVIAGADVRLVPNPNKGEFIVKGTLATKADKEVTMEITNMLGQVVFKTTTIARNGEIDARVKLENSLANGMYMLNLISENDKKVFHFVLEQ